MELRPIKVKLQRVVSFLFHVESRSSITVSPTNAQNLAPSITMRELPATKDLVEAQLSKLKLENGLCNNYLQAGWDMGEICPQTKSYPLSD